MARFSDDLLQQIRDRVPVSAIAGKTITLKKKGSELVGTSPFNPKEKTPSFTIYEDDRKWHDFSASKDGDVFAFLVEAEGKTFVEAVNICAELAGIRLPNGDGRAGGASALAGRASAPSADARADIPFDVDEMAARVDDRSGPAPIERSGKREITRTYDYTDAQGTLLYQVCRIEWTDEGKRKKTFIQRRPTPEGDGHWIWGLGAGEYIQSRSGDWLQVNRDRNWPDAKRRVITEDTPHGMYRLVEFLELRSPNEPVYLVEGEKDADTLRDDWGLVATTNSGGAGNFRAELADLFIGLDVVVVVDNDDAGVKRGESVGELLRGKATRVRVLNFGNGIWPGAKRGADITDWKNDREGSPEDLAEIVGKLPDWTPPPFHSRFGGIRFEDLDLPSPEHEYVIDGWNTVGDKTIVGGPSRSGKSFIAIHQAMCIATGMDFFGCKVLTPGLVVYQAGEGSRGIKKRFRAWRQYFGIKKSQLVPVYILQSKIDLYQAGGDTKLLIEELRGISKLYGMPIRALFIDTLAKAQGIADENSGKDMAAVMSNIDEIAAAMPSCNITLVHHFNAAGTKLRGHSSIYANIDQVILVQRDDAGRRSAVLDKQKDDDDGLRIDFELQRVVLGNRLDGKEITSCVTLQTGGSAERKDKRQRVRLSAERHVIFLALKEAIEEHGEETPRNLQLPRSIRKVIRAPQWKETYLKKNADLNATDNTINQRLRRASEQFQKEGIIGRENPWVWLTGKAVAGSIEVLPPQDDPPADDGQIDLIGEGQQNAP